MNDDLAYRRLRDKCRECDETGCWIWTAGMGGALKSTPVFHFPGTREVRRTMAAYKAAWILSGRKVPPGYHVYRACHDMRCVNPEHCKLGTHKMMGAHIAKAGKWRGRPNRIVACRRNLALQRTPETVVRQIEAMLGDGMTRKAIVAELGVGPGTVTSVKHGKHFHCVMRPKVLRGASVFAL